MKGELAEMKRDRAEGRSMIEEKISGLTAAVQELKNPLKEA